MTIIYLIFFKNYWYYITEDGGRVLFALIMFSLAIFTDMTLIHHFIMRS